ncbi:MAG TPA: DinB family protein [Candidatus Eisenbacteria bacterium]|nr:DinB family protein [Candidatus Eisenbacteria bacterium]
MSEGLLDSLRAHLEELTGLLALAGDRLERPRAGGSTEGWTARQVLGHLADFELVAAVRVRVVLSLDRPQLPAYGQEEFTDRFCLVETPAEAVERFAVNRRATLRVLEALEPADWERVGVHPHRGEESLRRTVEALARHDRAHLQQLREAAGA